MSEPLILFPSSNYYNLYVIYLFESNDAQILNLCNFLPSSLNFLHISDLYLSLKCFSFGFSCLTNWCKTILKEQVNPDYDFGTYLSEITSTKASNHNPLLS